MDSRKETKSCILQEKCRNCMKLGNFETTAGTQVFLLIHFYHSKEHNNYLELLFKKAMGFKDDADGNVRSQVNIL